MMIFLTLKMICDISLYFTFVIMPATVGFESPINGYMALLIYSVVFMLSVALDKKAQWMRFIPLLALPLVYLLAYNLVTVIMLTLPCIYVVFNVYRRGFTVDRLELKDQVRTSLKLVFIMPVFGLVVWWHDALSLYCIPYVLIFLVSMVYLLRSLRHGDTIVSQIKFLVMNLGAILGGLVLFVIAGSQYTLDAMWWLISSFYQYLIMPILFGAAYVVVGVAFFFQDFWEWILTRFGIEIPPTTPTEVEIVDGGSYQDFVPVSDGPTVVFEGLLIILAAIVVFAIFSRLILRSKRTSGDVTGVSSKRTMMSGIMSRPAMMAESLFAPRNPREAIRYHYRRFLKLCKQRGVPPKVHHTSLDVKNKNDVLFGAKPLEELRDIYISARYSDAEPTKDDSKRANDIVKQITDSIK